jgi:hypothetical protein
MERANSTKRDAQNALTGVFGNLSLIDCELNVFLGRSVPGAVATGSQFKRRSRSPDDDPVATALGTDLITQLDPLRHTA